MGILVSLMLSTDSGNVQRTSFSGGDLTHLHLKQNVIFKQLWRKEKATDFSWIRNSGVRPPINNLKTSIYISYTDTSPTSIMTYNSIIATLYPLYVHLATQN